VIIVDSIGWIAYFKGDLLATSYRPYIKQQQDLLCPSIIVYEVVKKIELDSGRQAAGRAGAQLSKSSIIPLDESLAEAAARVSVAHQLPMADAIIYTTAVVYQATLVTSDAHLQGLPGVHFITHPVSRN